MSSPDLLLEQVHSPAAAGRSTVGQWITFLFEDDRELWRPLIELVGFKRFSQTVAQRLGFGMAVAVFLFVMSVLLQLGESQETSGAGDSRDAEASANAWVHAETWEPLAGLSDSIDFQPGWESMVGSVANENYTFGSIESDSSRNVSGGAQAARVAVPGGANGAVTAGTTMGTGFGGGAPGSNLDSPTQQEAVPVPESVFSAVLLVIALLSILIVRYFVTVRWTRTAAVR